MAFALQCLGPKFPDPVGAVRLGSVSDRRDDTQSGADGRQSVVPASTQRDNLFVNYIALQPKHSKCAEAWLSLSPDGSSTLTVPTLLAHADEAFKTICCVERRALECGGSECAKFSGWLAWFKEACMKKMVGLIGLLILVALGWIAWPYYAVYDFANAIQQGDQVALERRVAWDSVRGGLRALQCGLLDRHRVRGWRHW